MGSKSGLEALWFDIRYGRRSPIAVVLLLARRRDGLSGAGHSRGRTVDLGTLVRDELSDSEGMVDVAPDLDPARIEQRRSVALARGHVYKVAIEALDCHVGPLLSTQDRLGRLTTGNGTLVSQVCIPVGGSQRTTTLALGGTGAWVGWVDGLGRVDDKEKDGIDAPDQSFLGDHRVGRRVLEHLLCQCKHLSESD